MSRYDKYSGVTGGFRAPLAADASPAQYDLVLGVGLDAQGRAVLGAAGATGFVGVTIVDRTKRKAGEIIDVMTHGEIVDLGNQSPAMVPGTVYNISAAGALITGAGVRVGHTVEADRLVVRFRPA